MRQATVLAFGNLSVLMEVKKSKKSENMIDRESMLCYFKNLCSYNMSVSQDLLMSSTDRNVTICNEYAFHVVNLKKLPNYLSKILHTAMYTVRDLEIS